jgi:hypothetical protein
MNEIKEKNKPKMVIKNSGTNRKRKIVLIVFGILMIFLLCYISAASFNYVPMPGVNSMIKYPDSGNIAKITVGNIATDEILIDSTIVEELGKFNQTIELELSGIKNNNAADVFEWYKSEYAKSGWEMYNSGTKKGDDWKLYYGAWTKGIMVQVTATLEGKVLEEYVTFDVILGSVLTNMIEIGLSELFKESS